MGNIDIGLSQQNTKLCIAAIGNLKGEVLRANCKRFDAARRPGTGNFKRPASDRHQADITLASATTTASMFLLLMAATQMRPESRP